MPLLSSLIASLGAGGTSKSAYRRFSGFSAEDFAKHSTIVGTATYTPPGGGTAEERVVMLVPMDIESRDRGLSGSLPAFLADMNKIDITITNTTTEEVIVSYTDIFQKNSQDTFVYVSEDDIFSDPEIDQFKDGANGDEIEQDIVFVYNAEGGIDFYTTASQLGTLEIKLTANDSVDAVMTHELTEDMEFSDLIDTIAEFIDDADDGNFTEMGSIWDFPEPIADTGGGIIVTAAAFGNTAANSIPFDPIAEYRGLISKVIIPWMKKQLEVSATTGMGFVYGAWDGLKSDYEGVVEVLKLIFSNPYRTACEIYHTFKALAGVSFDDFKAMVENTYNGFLDNQIDRIPWLYKGTPSQSETLIVNYMVGYGCGFITEQVLITVGTAGLGRIGTVGKVGRYISQVVKQAQNASIVIQNGAEAASKFKAGFNKFVSQYVTSTGNGREIRQLSERLSKEIEFEGQPIGAHMQNGIDEIGDANFGYSDIVVDEMFEPQHGGLVDASDLKVGAYATQIAKMMQILGPHASPDAVKGFVRLYNRLITSENSNQITDNFNKFVELYDTSTPTGTQELAKFLEDSKDILINPLSKLPNGGFPSNRGFAGTPSVKTIQSGTILDRYGSNGGEFLALDSPPFWARSLPDSSATSTYRQYEVLIDFDANVGRTAPWFNKSGGGLQADLGVGNSVQNLIDAGIIREIL